MKIKIVDKRELPSAEPARAGKMDVMITYQLDSFRTYIVVIPQERFNEQELRTRIKADIAEREKWSGKELEL